MLSLLLALLVQDSRPASRPASPVSSRPADPIASQPAEPLSFEDDAEALGWEPQSEVILEGTVFVNDEPRGGAHIEIQGTLFGCISAAHPSPRLQTVSAPDGRYQLRITEDESLCGPLCVRVDVKEGSNAFPLDLPWNSAATRPERRRVPMDLPSRFGSVSVRCVDPHGQPANVWVTSIPWFGGSERDEARRLYGSPTWETQRTDSDGRALIKCLLGNVYALKIKDPLLRFAPMLLDRFTVGTTPVQLGTIVLEEAAELTVIVEPWHGERPQGTVVVRCRADERDSNLRPLRHEEELNGRDAIHLRGLKPGDGWVELQAHGMAPIRKALSLKPGAASVVRL